MAVYEEVVGPVRRGPPLAALREQVAGALVNKGVRAGPLAGRTLI